MDSDHQADKARLLGVQRKLYRWRREHADDSCRALWSWITDPRNLRCAWTPSPCRRKLIPKPGKPGSSAP